MFYFELNANRFYGTNAIKYLCSTYKYEVSYQKLRYSLSLKVKKFLLNFIGDSKMTLSEILLDKINLI